MRRHLRHIVTLLIALALCLAWTGCGAGTGKAPPPTPSQASFVYTGNGGSDDVSALKEDANTGTLSSVSGSPFQAGDINENVPGVVAVSPSGKFLYVGDANSAEISAYSINAATGVLTEVAGSPFPSGPSASIRVHPAGQFLYAANFDHGSISVFAIDPATGALTEISGSPFGVAAMVISLALHPSGNFAYATFLGMDGLLGIAAFSIDSNTGVITQVANSRLDLQAGNLTMHPSGKFLYSARNSLFLTFSSAGGTAGIWALNVDSVTGALTPA